MFVIGREIIQAQRGDTDTVGKALQTVASTMTYGNVGYNIGLSSSGGEPSTPER